MRFNKEDLPKDDKPIVVQDEKEMYVTMATDLIKTTPPLQYFFGAIGACALESPDCQDPVDMFSYAFALGFAKALHDINKGYINFKTITKDLGETHEDNKGSDH